jgi:hypothetical protein
MPKPRIPFLLVYVLPFIHLCACLIVAFARIETGWEQLIKFDFPFSIVLAGLTFRLDHPLIWFGILGTLWWYLWSWIVWLIFTGEWRHRFN